MRARTAEEDNLSITFIHGDLRDVDFGSDPDLIMLIFGEFNTFTRPEALAILRKCRDALADGGQVDRRASPD